MFYDILIIIYIEYIFHVKIQLFFTRIRIRIGLAPWIRICIRIEVKNCQCGSETLARSEKTIKKTSRPRKKIGRKEGSRMINSERRKKG
jgi:hypothetical protein